MAPKGQLPQAKLTAILSYLRNSGTVHNIKELEKALPNAASINGMQVKDYLQALQDENLISVEKIGSGNWYWSFADDELKIKEATLEKLVADVNKLRSSITSMMESMQQLVMSEQEHKQQQELMTVWEAEKADVAKLEQELAGFRDGDPAELAKRREDAVKMGREAEQWTDNIYVLEQKIAEMLGGDREQLESLKRDIYGAEYVEGEGLREV